MTIDNVAFSQTNPVAGDPRNSPSLAGELTNLNTELGSFESSFFEGWFREAASIIRLANNSFSVSGNVTAFYSQGRKIRINIDSSPVYVTVSSSSFNAGVTTVTTYETTVPGSITTLDLAAQVKGGILMTQYGQTLQKPTINGSVQGATTDVDGSTVTFDLSASNVHGVTLGGNRTLALSNVTTDQFFVLRLIQDGTGSRTVTWFSGIKWPNNTVPTLTATPSKTDVFGFHALGGGVYEGFIVGQNL